VTRQGGGQERRGPLRLAVVGGRRGHGFDRALTELEDTVRLTAVCDLVEDVLAQWKAQRPDARTFTRYEDLLESEVCDAVYLATPLQMHARQAIAALQAGKHVLSEVVAAHTIDDCWALVEAVEASGCTYMLAENYCYMRSNMLVLNMVEHGLFGELTYAEGAYLHDCRDLMFTPAGALTWRGELRRDTPGNSYPTHSLGPPAQWLGINRRDRLVEMVTFISQNASARRYAAARFGVAHPAAAPSFFRGGDSASTLIRTASGAVIYLRVDWASARPHNMAHYVLQGTTGAYLSSRCAALEGRAEEPLVWIEGRSPGVSPPAPGQEAAQWQSLWDYASAFEHPLWTRWGREAIASGHGGGDFLVLAEFCNAVLGGTPAPIDVYDAVTWSCLLPLSVQSVQEGGRSVPIPDFTRSQRYTRSC
jgi:predicted dehydrogenase